VQTDHDQTVFGRRNADFDAPQIPKFGAFKATPGTDTFSELGQLTRMSWLAEVRLMTAQASTAG
jgi:hypothetical protein